MKIKEIFASDVTRRIPPVVYFHEQDPHKVAEEVAEYIITGGYPEGSPRYMEGESGIHEQFVNLLQAIASDIEEGEAVELPASWISGFFGSGKSSFAKLLGLALNGMTLPDGRTLADALLAQDDSPLAAEFREAWQRLISLINPMAVVFDIGTEAKNDEHIHNVIRRQVQRRLGYCAKSAVVADHELKLELDGKWDAFLACVERRFGEPWAEVKNHHLVEDEFSEVLHLLFPERYQDPMSWFESRVGTLGSENASVAETTRAIADMLAIRAPDKTLFIVVDEVSQFIHQSDTKMLKLQSLVSDLGKRLKGKVWLLCTGQQKLEDTEETMVLSKLKDRFPHRYRVHLSAANIRDVVHKRLLKKNPAKEQSLRNMYHENRSNLKLYGFSCANITEDDFLEVYPLLPEYVDLLMEITSNLRLISTRFKGDEQAIRGLLQLLGELFRNRNLGEREVGELITIDDIYDIQQSALDPDTQNTMRRILRHPLAADNQWIPRVAKAVCLLELVQEQRPTKATLVAQCLYSRMEQGSIQEPVQRALDALKDEALLTYSEKTGYKLQSSAGKEWQRERDSISITGAEVSAIIGEKLKELVQRVERPKFKNKGFPWAARFNDKSRNRSERLIWPNDMAVLRLSFEYSKNRQDRAPTFWINYSASDEGRNLLIWVCGEVARLEREAKLLGQSRRIIKRYEPTLSSLQLNQQRMFYEEQTRREERERELRELCSQVFAEGELYFRGRKIAKEEMGSTFTTILQRTAGAILPELYHKFVDMAVTSGELKQLLEYQLSGPSSKFMEGGLGILSLDAGKYIADCTGEVPGRIMQWIDEQNGATGNQLFEHFGSPPYGYAQDVVKACVAGLLRGKKVRIRTSSEQSITSVNDPGVQDFFLRDRDIKKADILPNKDKLISRRDIVQICRFFNEYLGRDPDRDQEAIADESFFQFKQLLERIENLEKQYQKIEGKWPLPETIIRLRTLLSECTGSRQVEPTVLKVKKHLQSLKEGISLLKNLETEVNDEAIPILNRAICTNNLLIRQLKEVENIGDLADAVEEIERLLENPRPFRNIADSIHAIEAVESHYRELRQEFIYLQEQKAQQIRHRIKQRPGFEKLNDNEQHKVLRPITEMCYRTNKQAHEPTLDQLRNVENTRLAEAENIANRRLDDFLAEIEEIPTKPFRLDLTGRELETEQDVERLLKELRERLLAQLKENYRLRLM